MAPTPISLLDSGLNTQNMYRTWDSSPVEAFQPKVGAHLPLSKRNSTPVGVGMVNPFAAAQQLKLSLAQVQMASASQLGAGSPEPHVNTHKVLDRCHSEPAGSVQLHPTMSSRYKTELCRPFQETGFCKYGEKCQFAHGGTEMRNLQRHPKYKTELCRTFHTTGLCAYGTRCHFIHNSDERRNKSPTEQAPSSVPVQQHTLSPVQHQISPPNSLHGSPTAPSGAFFGDAFIAPTPSILCSDETSSNTAFSLLTPPVSPVESLAGDVENMSLSPALPEPAAPLQVAQHVPSIPSLPSNLSAILDPQRYARLPIFESLKEIM